MRADLHVHSWHSGLNGDLAFLHSRDCYSSPDDVYRVARARGMDLVTITDHDSIDGCMELLERPDASDVIVGEEISCWWPDTTLEIHIGAYGMTERVHRELQPLRRHAREMLAFLRSAGVVSVLNHPFHFYRGQVPLAEYLTIVSHVDAVETRNGAMLPAHNALASRLAIDAGRGQIGGSDAHSLRRVGRTWTEAAATTRDDFLTALRAGRGRAGGAHKSVTALAGDIYNVIGSYWCALAGREACDRSQLGAMRRTVGVAFSVVTLPFELTPLVVSAVKKHREANVVRQCVEQLAAAEPRPTGTTTAAPELGG
jgi:predicted metal-dependent phosphoesterase TrpH